MKNGLAEKHIKIIGKRFGMLMVVKEFWNAEFNQYECLCLCECGNCITLTRTSVEMGYITSCGCAQEHEKIGQLKSKMYGRKFGKIVPYAYAGVSKNKTMMFSCICSCGNTKTVLYPNLKYDQTKSCGCFRSKHVNEVNDLKGKRFHSLVVIEKSRVSDLGTVFWKCQCDCGNLEEYSGFELLSNRRKSCGCRKTEQQQGLNQNLTRVEGTCIEHIRIRKNHKNNTSGFRGVRVHPNGKYSAYIGMQKKRINLGVYESLEDAIAARLKAEEELYDKFLDDYDRRNK